MAQKNKPLSRPDGHELVLHFPEEVVGQNITVTLFLSDGIDTTYFELTVQVLPSCGRYTERLGAVTVVLEESVELERHGARAFEAHCRQRRVPHAL